MFEKTLQDVVKGIRANKRDPSDYISATIAEIKVELRSSDAFVKAQAVSDRKGNRDATFRGTSRDAEMGPQGARDSATADRGR